LGIPEIQKVRHVAKTGHFFAFSAFPTDKYFSVQARAFGAKPCYVNIIAHQQVFG
jgi:hypothetical protein